MPGRISDTVIQQILERVNLAELIGQQVKLKRSGKNFVGLCPFHSDGKPSFTVSSDRGFYHCYGCHEGGNAISYLMKSRGFGFREAASHLADIAGIELEFEEGDARAWKETREKKRVLFNLNRDANAWYRVNLRSADGNEALRYLQGREISDEMISRFQIGFAPHGSGLHDSLVRSGAPMNFALELGLLSKRRDGSIGDRFRNRITFPIMTVSDDIAGFSARTLEADGIPKYLNSPDSELFRKGELLFGMVQAREMMKKDDFTLLVEGQIDALALHQAGFTNAVAPLGTALTEHQCAVIRRFTSNVIIMFDGDGAGIKATWRSLGILMSQGLYGKVVSLPEGSDPDSLLRDRGAEALQKAVETARPFMEYALGHLVSQSDGSLHGRTDAGRLGVELANQFKSMLDRDVFLEQLASELRLPLEQLKSRSRGGSAPDSGDDALRLIASIPPREKRLLQLILRKPDLSRHFSDESAFAFLTSDAGKELVLALLDAYEEEGRVDVQALLERLDLPELLDIYAGLVLGDYDPPPEELDAEMLQKLQLEAGGAHERPGERRKTDSSGRGRGGHRPVLRVARGAARDMESNRSSGKRSGS